MEMGVAGQQQCAGVGFGGATGVNMRWKRRRAPAVLDGLELSNANIFCMHHGSSCETLSIAF